MDDLISRQAAIDAIQERMDSFRHADCEWAMNAYNGACECAGAIKSLPSAQPEVIRCKDCKWWTKQKDSIQGRCDLMQMYPTGEWFCGNAQERRTDEQAVSE